MDGYDPRYSMKCLTRGCNGIVTNGLAYCPRHAPEAGVNVSEPHNIVTDEGYRDRSAYQEPEALVGNGTRIWRWTHIGKNAKIGKNCSIGQCCEIDGFVGEGCRIQNGVQLYHGVTLGRFVFVGPNVTFTNDLRPRLGYDWTPRETKVRDHASIGAGSVIVCGVTIGEYAMVAAGSVVTRDIPPYGSVRGNPARLVGYVCKRGHPMAIAGNGVWTCEACETRMEATYSVSPDW